MKNRQRAINEIVGELVTRGVEEWHELQCLVPGGETKESWSGINLTLDELEYMGMNRNEAWVLICDGCCELVERSLS